LQGSLPNVEDEAICYVLKLPPYPLLTWDLTWLQQCIASDRNLIFYSFPRLIAIVANTNAHTYAREEQILAIRMIVLQYKNQARIYH